MIYVVFECDGCEKRVEIQRKINTEIPMFWRYHYVANASLLMCQNCNKELDRQGYA